MLKHIKILIILAIVFLNFGCSERNITSISDCEPIKNEAKRDDCFVKLIETVPQNNVESRIAVCDKIYDEEIKDFCLFKTIREGWRNIPFKELEGLCMGTNESAALRSLCEDINNRPHLQSIM